jgi:putative transposase
VLLRLANLGVTNVFALLRLLPMSGQDKDAGCCATNSWSCNGSSARPQCGSPRLTGVAGGTAAPAPEGRTLALAPGGTPDTVLRWHRDMLARRHARRSRPGRPSRPRTARSIRGLVLRLVRENPGWGYRRVHGELLVLGVKVAASTVWEILHKAGIDPAPERDSATWAGFLRSQAESLLACDFFETVTPSGARLHVLAVIEDARRRIRILGATAHPTASWVVRRPGTS